MWEGGWLGHRHNLKGRGQAWTSMADSNILGCVLFPLKQRMKIYFLLEPLCKTSENGHFFHYVLGVGMRGRGAQSNGNKIKKKQLFVCETGIKNKFCVILPRHVYTTATINSFL